MPQLDEAPVRLKADSDDPKAVTARSLGYTGKGVKVAWIADGIDPQNVNFRRDPSDPSSTVFSDYKDFSGDGPDAETAGGEAFLDANAIAGQGQHVYDVSGFSATPTAGPCNVRIEGVAPGAQLVGLKVFSEGTSTTESNFLQAIDYAVQQDHVDVLNESFGSNPFPDVTSADVTKQFNDEAVAAGVTVTVSSGDAGPFNTTGSPSTDPKVLAVGATTTFRYYAQTNYAIARSFAPNGWLDDGISGLSSSGVDEDGGVLNVVAPGDLSWASCDPTAEFDDCVNYKNEPSDIEDSGGTSESAPLAAGSAALVIQAYEQAHGGRRPAPATVKQLLTSTATDLGAPAEEQGAGLIDDAKAVQLAASMQGGAMQGDTLVKSVDELSATGRPGSRHTFAVGLTNTGTRTQHIAVSGRAIGGDSVVSEGAVTLSDAVDPKVLDWAGRSNNYRKVVFRVPRGQDRLTAEYAYPGDPTTGLSARVRLDLVTPDGKLAAHSIPQGVGDHGFVDVLHPAAGTWTAYIYSPVSSLAGTVGRVPYRFATERYTGFASVGRHSVTLAPGASTTVTLSARTPSMPGDATGSLVIDSDLAGPGSVPVVLRSSIDVASGGRYSGVLTGGNGRQQAAQQQYYTFDVPKGVRNITANLRLGTEPQNIVGLYLVSPHGDAAGYGQNTLGTSSSLAATAWTLKPAPGRWTLVVVFETPTAGDLLRIPFTGSVVFDAAKADAAGLPSGGTLTAGTAVTVPVTVRNNGRAPAQFFVDARLSGTGVVPLADLTGSTTYAVPSDGTIPEWFVPTETRRVATAATGSLPIQYDLSLASGDPDVGSIGLTPGTLCSKTEVATYATQDRATASGIWYAVPSECGSYSGPAPTGTARFAAVAVTRPFDPAVTSSTGDVELLATDPATAPTPVTIAPGGTATVSVTITPTGTPGTRVSGSLFVDSATDDVPPYDQFSGDELVELPYSYTIG